MFFKKNKKIRFAAFGFRSIPPKKGSAGADSIFLEIARFLVKRGYSFIGYNRIYEDDSDSISNYEGINLINIKTVTKAGFDSFIHSLKSTLHIIFKNTANIIVIGNGGNSIWAGLLRILGKKVIVMQDGFDWRRDKWPWYAKLYLYFCNIFTAHFPNKVIFDNIYVKEWYEKKFKKEFNFIPLGGLITTSEIVYDNYVLNKLKLEKDNYFLFVGRFIPDKGLHYLIPAFNKVKTKKKLVLVGGVPNPSAYELEIKSTNDKRIIFPGYIYGNEVLNLIKNAYLYIQPSDIEGLSPVIFTAIRLGTPLLCSDIQENIYIVGDKALTFEKSNIQSLTEKINFSLKNYSFIKKLAHDAKLKVNNRFEVPKILDDILDTYLS